MTLLDANILVRIADFDDPKHLKVIQAVLELPETEAALVLPQCFYEFVAVATRAPRDNGLGMEVRQAMRWLANFLAMFRFVPDPPELSELWMHIVETHKVTGFRVHDARYVAAMQALGVDRIMTLNPKHFAAYPIQVIDPSAV